MVIGIAGPSASGKTTIAKMLEEELQAVRLRYSDILAEIAKERKLDVTDKSVLQNLYLSEREKRGENWLSEEMAEKAAGVSGKHLVIEGNRRKVDYETLCRIAAARGDTVKLLFIDARPEIRFARFNKYPDEHGYQKVTLEEFINLENNEAEAEIPYFKEIAEREGIYIDTSDCDVEESKKLVREALSIPVSNKN